MLIVTFKRVDQTIYKTIFVHKVVPFKKSGANFKPALSKYVSVTQKLSPENLECECVLLFVAVRAMTAPPPSSHVPVIVGVLIVFIFLILTFAVLLIVWRSVLCTTRSCVFLTVCATIYFLVCLCAVRFVSRLHFSSV